MMSELEKNRVKCRAWYNRTKIARRAIQHQKNAAWRKANRKKCADAIKRWTLKNRNKVRGYKKKWEGLNLDKRRAYCMARRARIKGVKVGDPSKIVEIYRRAATLRKCGYNVHVDHIVPLSKGGEHSANNLRIVSASDNQHKSDQLDYDPIFLFP